MSNLVFPLEGHTYSVFKTPTWATRTQRAVSGRELTLRDYANPIWNFKMSFDALQEAQPAPAVLSTLVGNVRKLMDFFNSVGGGFDTWLFDDTTDDSVTDEPIGVGNGTKTAFQLVRHLYAGGFAESIIAPHTVSAVKLNGTPTSAYTLDSSTGIITFTSAPGAGVVITASFTFYFRCRFMMDTAEFENILHRRWQIQDLRFKSIVL